MGQPQAAWTSDVEQAMVLHAEGLDKLPVHEIWADQDSESDEDNVEAFDVSAENAYEFLQDPEDPYEIEDIFDGEETDGLPVLKVFKGQPFQKKFLRGRRSNPREYQRRRTQFKVRASIYRSKRRQAPREKGVCWTFQKTGSCPNKDCKFRHVTGSKSTKGRG